MGYFYRLLDFWRGCGGNRRRRRHHRHRRRCRQVQKYSI